MIMRMSSSVKRSSHRGQDVLDDHLVFRHGAGLVHTQRVHARERLDAAELVHEGLALGQTHHACHERKACQQIQALGIMPMMEPTVLVTAIGAARSRHTNSLMNSPRRAG